MFNIEINFSLTYEIVCKKMSFRINFVLENFFSQKIKHCLMVLYPSLKNKIHKYVLKILHKEDTEMTCADSKTNTKNP